MHMYHRVGKDEIIRHLTVALQDVDTTVMTTEEGEDTRDISSEMGYFFENHLNFSISDQNVKIFIKMETLLFDGTVKITVQYVEERETFGYCTSRYDSEVFAPVVEWLEQPSQSDNNNKAYFEAVCNLFKSI